MDVERDQRWVRVHAWPLAVIATDLDGQIFYANPAAERLYGFPLDRMVGASVMDVLVPAREQDPAVDIMATVLGGGVWAGEFDVLRGDSTTVRAHVTDFPLWEDDRVVGVVGVSHEVGDDSAGELSQRLADLGRVAAELAAARDLSGIAEAVTRHAAAALQADAVGLAVLERDGLLRLVALNGGRPGAAERYASFSVDEPYPLAEAVRTGRLVSVAGAEEVQRRYPGSFEPDRRYLLAVPLLVNGAAVGAIGLGFAWQRALSVADSDFLHTLAETTGQAFDRVWAVERAREATARLELLAQASLRLSASLDFQETVDAVTQLFVPRFADWAVVQVLRGGTLETVSVHHPDPAQVAWVRSLEGRWPVDMQAPTGGPAVVRTGRSEVYPAIPAEMIEAGARDAEHLAALRALGLSSALVVPLTGRAGPIGAITLIHAESGRRYDDADVGYVEDVARRAAFALETADVVRDQLGRLASVAQVADAAQRAILADPQPQVGPFRLAARYLSAAAEARVGGDLYEDVPYRGGVRLIVGDVRGKGLAAVHTAAIVLGEFRAAADDLDDLAAVAAQIDRRLRRHLLEEDFVTACFVELAADGSFQVASAGHPAPLHVATDAIREVLVQSSPPLGLGPVPVPAQGRLAPGERLVLYTDGLTEARRPDGSFVPLHDLLAGLSGLDLGAALDSVLHGLRVATGGSLADDLALLAVEYAGR